tara:strand:- start:54 stop:1349 length:1296 start_codon:yes stop_codon:yes gene_type:complete
MKKLFSCFVIGILTIPFLGNKSKADVRFFVNQKDNKEQEIIKMTSTPTENKFELLTTYEPENNNITFNDHWYDSEQNKLYFQLRENFAPIDKFAVYDFSNDIWSTETINNVTTDSTPTYMLITDGDTSNASKINTNESNISTNTSNISINDTDITTLQSLLSPKSGSTTTSRIGDSTKNTLEIGPTINPTTIDQSGISVAGGNLIKKDSDGNIHIGKNSFVIGDEVLKGAHPIWAEDENGTKIPLNIYGSDLQINGVSVQNQIDNNTSNISTNTSNIKNLGEGVAGSTALTAALSALPQTSKESKLSCGVGTGAYSSRYAVGFGCASKVNKRIDINAGGSYVFGGSKSYGSGTLDSGVMKAGFVFKLGKINKDKLISKKENQLDQKVTNLQTENKELKNLIAVQNTRLEKLEKIALALKLNTNLEVISMVK